MGYPHDSNSIKQKLPKQSEIDSAVRFEREVKRIEKFINSKMSDDTEVACWRANNGYMGGPVVTCRMTLRKKYTGIIPPRYVHHLEAVTYDIAISLYRSKSPPSFDIATGTQMAPANVRGSWLPICHFVYSKELDTFPEEYMMP
jgi:hypothetical protein